jgi:metallo-beta-lactamase superfamily protein
MDLKFTLGDLTIHRIIEQETTFLPALELFPALTPDLLAENRQWMRQSGALDAEDVLILCFQSYVVKTPHHTILIDSCIGNDKPRPLRPKWNMKTDETYMRALTSAGFSVDDIDFVMCTHLHVDHVGWNTRLEGGRWVPTFPTRAMSLARPSSTTGRSKTRKRRCRLLSTVCCRSSKRGRPRSCGTIMRSAITCAFCRRQATRPDISRLRSAEAGMKPFSAAT